MPQELTKVGIAASDPPVLSVFLQRAQAIEPNPPATSIASIFSWHFSTMVPTPSALRWNLLDLIFHHGPTLFRRYMWTFMFVPMRSFHPQYVHFVAGWDEKHSNTRILRDLCEQKVTNSGISSRNHGDHHAFTPKSYQTMPNYHTRSLKHDHSSNFINQYTHWFLAATVCSLVPRTCRRFFHTLMLAMNWGPGVHSPFSDRPK